MSPPSWRSPRSSWTEDDSDALLSLAPVNPGAFGGADYYSVGRDGFQYQVRVRADVVPAGEDNRDGRIGQRTPQTRRGIDSALERPRRCRYRCAVVGEVLDRSSEIRSLRRDEVAGHDDGSLDLWILCGQPLYVCEPVAQSLEGLLLPQTLQPVISFRCGVPGSDQMPFTDPKGLPPRVRLQTAE